MPYITKADVLQVIEAALLTQLVDFEGDGTQVDARVDACIVEAQSLVDSKLATRYAVPVSPVPDIVKTYMLDITIYRLYLRRLGATDAVTDAFNMAMRQLDKIASGSTAIDASPAAAGATSSHTVKSSSKPRLFDRDSMRDF